jgi:hypothetical protein
MSEREQPIDPASSQADGELANSELDSVAGGTLSGTPILQPSPIYPINPLPPIIGPIVPLPPSPEPIIPIDPSIELL